MEHKLSSRCLLVSVEINLPSQSKKDKAVTNEIHEMKDASRKAGRYSANLWTDGALDACQKQGAVLRQIVEKYSTPWKKGQRVMLCSAMIKMQEALNPHIAEFERMADLTAAKFDEHIAAAQRDRNGMFRRADYPLDAAEFRAGFKCKVEYLPLPDESHIVLEAAEDEIRIIKECTQAKLAESQREAKEHLRDEIAAPLKALVKQLRNYDDKKQSGDRTRLCDSLLANIADIGERVGLLNITGDAHLDSFGSELKSLADSTSIDILKVSGAARRSMTDRANTILAKLNKQQQAEAA